MLGIMGNIDQQVNDRADSMQMRGKTSTVSKDLLDVMATQKIAREKDTALKELQMAQQTDPNTIKDQLEQKVMGMTQNEMTTQAGGILAQRAQQKGKPQPPRPGGIAGAMGGAPKPPMPMGGAPKPPMPMGGAPKPPMGGAPRPPMGGMAAMGGAPRPMMASGGIVGYNKGSTVISDEKLKELGMTRETFNSLPKAAQARLAKPLSNQEAAQQRMAARQAELGKNIVARRADKEAEKKKMNEGFAKTREAQARAAAEAAGLQIAEPAGTIGPEEMAEMNAAAAKVGTTDAQRVSDQLGLNIDPKIQQLAMAQVNNQDASTGTQGGPTAATATTGPQAGGGPPIGGIGTAAQMAADLTKQSVAPTEDQLSGIASNAVSARMDEIAPGAMKNIKEDSKIDLDTARTTTMDAQTKRYLPEKGEGSMKGLKALQDNVLAEKQRQAGIGDAGKAFRDRQRRENFFATAGRRGRASRDQFNREAAATLDARKTAVDQYADRMTKTFDRLKNIDENTNTIVQQQLDRRNNAINAVVNTATGDVEAKTAQVDQIIAQNQAAINSQMQALGILSEAEMAQAAAMATNYQLFTDQLTKIQLAEDKLYDLLVDQQGAMFENLDPDDPQRIAKEKELRGIATAHYMGIVDIALEAIAKAGGKNPEELKRLFKQTPEVDGMKNKQANVSDASANSAQFIQ